MARELSDRMIDRAEQRSNAPLGLSGVVWGAVSSLPHCEFVRSEDC